MPEHFQLADATEHAGGATLGAVSGSGRISANIRGRQDFAGSLAHLAVGWQQQPDHSGYDLVTDIVAGAVGVVPGCEHAALVIYDQQLLIAKAVSGPDTAAMIALQNELGEGPCRDTAAQNQVYRATDVARDPRWVRLGVRAVELGIGSMLCTPLMVGPRSYGSLSMASGVPNAFSAEAEGLAQIFATHAAIALAAADRQETLTAALESRDLIGQAKGILMGRYGLTAEKAFSVLVRESKNYNIKLREVSSALCSTGQLPSDSAGRSTSRRW